MTTVIVRDESVSVVPTKIDGIANLSEDTTPQLGGHLDCNGKKITSPLDPTDEHGVGNRGFNDLRYPPQVNLLLNAEFKSNSQSMLADYSDPNTGFTQQAPTSCCTDPDDDQDVTTGWASINAATLSSEAGGDTGNCLKVLCDGTNNPGTQKSSIAVVAGELWQFTGNVKSNGSEATYNVQLYDDQNVVTIWSSGNLESANDWTTTWNKVVKIPDGCTTVKLTLYSITTAGAGTHTLFDDVSFSKVIPAYVGADIKAPNEWQKDTTLHLYVIDSTKDGSRKALKSVTSAANDYLNFPTNNIRSQLDWLARFSSQTVTLIMWVKTSTIAHIQLSITDNIKTTYSSYHTGSGDWELLSVTHTFGANLASYAYFRIHFLINAAEAEITQPMLVIGSYCSAFVPTPGEIVNCNTNIALTDYTADAVAADTTVELASQSNGKIPNGCKAVSGLITGQNSAPAKYLDILSKSGGMKSARLTSQVAAQDNSIPFRAVCNPDGDIYLDVEDSNFSNVTIQINAIEVR